MFVCQWHLDTPYGRQSEALRVMRIVPASQHWKVYRVAG